MANYNGKLDLTKFGKAALVKGKAGQPCLMIDIMESGLYLSEKTGSVYLDFVCWESERENQSHTIKQQFGKMKQEELKSLPKEERYKLDPILGNLKAMVTSATPAATPVAYKQQDLVDDLPW